MKRILVVDDERQITRMLRASLQSNGYEVTVAGNGVEAYALFEADRPDLIITDLAMPEMNGLELTQAVRRVAADAHHRAERSRYRRDESYGAR